MFSTFSKSKNVTFYVLSDYHTFARTMNKGYHSDITYRQQMQPPTRRTQLQQSRAFVVCIASSPISVLRRTRVLIHLAHCATANITLAHACRRRDVGSCGCSAMPCTARTVLRAVSCNEPTTAVSLAGINEAFSVGDH